MGVGKMKFVSEAVRARNLRVYLRHRDLSFIAETVTFRVHASE